MFLNTKNHLNNEPNSIDPIIDKKITNNMGYVKNILSIHCYNNSFEQLFVQVNRSNRLLL